MESTGPCITCGSTKAPYVVNTEKGVVCADVYACKQRAQARDLYTTPVVYDAELAWCAACGAAKSTSHTATCAREPHFPAPPCSRCGGNGLDPEHKGACGQCSVGDEFRPDWVSAPGETIVDILGERQVAVSDWAKAMGLSAEDAGRLVNGDMPITDHIAQALARELGPSVEFWIRREQHYREGLARRAAPLDPDQTWRNGL